MLNKTNQKRSLIATLSCLLALILLLGTVCSCKFAAREKVESPVLEYGEQGIPLSFYSLLLSRMKGSLAVNRYDVKSESFWSSKVEGTEQTHEEYFNASILESCKNYLCALVLFEAEGLSLPESVTAAIDEEIEYYISLGYIGGGDEEKFNSIIEPYGVDAESLKEAYEIEAKYEYLLAYLYGSDASLIGDVVKEEFYRENYYRFKQIILPNFYYEYEKDEQGNEIYFDEESGKRLYDEENGSPIYDENGNRLKDENGDTIYFDATGKILYDKENGKRSVILDENGEALQYLYSESGIAEREKLAGEIIDSLDEGDHDLFEQKMKEYNVDFGDGESYGDGYYLSAIESALYEDYMLEMLDALEEMEVGEYRLIKSDYGYHVIMKYELDEGKYADGEYAEWFTSFNDALINEMFLEKCRSIASDITVNEENMAKAKSIKELGINYDY